MLDEGVYKYESGEWIRVSVKELKGDTVIVYFDNIKCPFCRIFDPIWQSLAEDEDLSGIVFYIVMCTFFHKNCRSIEAKNLYIKYRVTKSPTVLIIKRKDDGSEEVIEVLPSKFKYNYELIKNYILSKLS